MSSKRGNLIIPYTEVEKNKEYMNDIRNISVHFEQLNGRKPLASTRTYGCQMNEHDTEKIKGMLESMGYEETDVEDGADLIIFNTCCVRENAELKVYGNLGHLKALKKNNPDLKIVVCGCMMQQPHIVEEIKKKYPFVSIVFGTHNLYNFPSLLLESFESKKTVVEVWDSEGEIIEGLPSIRKFEAKAFINIMYGCNNFCSYCIVPYTRGRERSRTVDDIIDEITDLVENGVKEVTLLGQNVNSYGHFSDTDPSKNVDFADLLVEVNKIEGVQRIRFMTSHPKDISNKLIDTMASLDKVCEHLHLPIQTGSNDLLKRMNRKYTTEKYLEILDYAKNKIPNLSVSTDFIIGFPGETEVDIEETLDLIKKAEFDTAFTYVYSRRRGTPAYSMENQVSDEVKQKRFKSILDSLNDIIIIKNKAKKDMVFEVLVEGQSKNNPEFMTGRNRNFDNVNFKGDDSLIGKIVKVKVTEPRKFSLNGIIVE